MIANLKGRVLEFLERQKGKAPGFFRFSYSGDLHDESERWGLGASAFAAKIYQMLGEINSIDAEYKERWIKFVKEFEKNDGEIFDPLISKKSFLHVKLSAFRRFYFGNFFNAETRRAETRQSWATLEILGSRPGSPYAKLPKNKKDISVYIRSLNWRKNPWSAASHASHLLFFFAREKEWFNLDREEDILAVIDELNALQSPVDGSWHKNSALPNNERVNAAMKVISGLVAARRAQFPYPEKLIDLCLAQSTDLESCSNVDRIYALYWAGQLTSHRSSDILAFAQKKLQQYEASFRPEGGFSFYPNKAQHFYYGARITKGLDEPDMQGTVLGLWGYIMLLKMLKSPQAEEFDLPTV